MIALPSRTLLGPKFTKASLGHEPDGLVFQPSDEAYEPGRDDRILKWKPHTHNSVDFKLQVRLAHATFNEMIFAPTFRNFAVLGKTASENPIRN